MVRLGEAGNVQGPAVLALKAKGFRVKVEHDEADRPLWLAERDGNVFGASEPLALLGLVALWETRGEDWNRKADPTWDQIYDEAEAEGPIS